MLQRAGPALVRAGNVVGGQRPGSDYPNIQAAINSPSVRSGDTINVEPGTYPDAALPGDTVTVTKPLTIIGGQAYPRTHQAGPSVVTSDAVGFTLDAGNISIQQFTVQPAKLTLGTAGIATAPAYLGAGYQIRKNLLEDEQEGLYLNTAASSSASPSTVCGNSFQADIYGIYSDLGLNNVTISQNAFTGSSGKGNGVDSASPGGANNVILNNTVTNFNFGIALAAASHDMVSYNTIQGNAGSGIILTRGCTNNTVSANQVNGNGGGIFLLDSGGNTITSNTADNNANIGIAAAGGSRNFIGGNTVNSSTKAAGIVVLAGDSNVISCNQSNYNFAGVASIECTNTRICGNTASYNRCVGIEVQDDLNASGQADTVQGNTANNNATGGIFSGLSTYVLISGNTVVASTHFGIQLYNYAEAITYDTLSGNVVSGTTSGSGISLVKDDNTTLLANATNRNAVDGISLQTSCHDAISGNNASANLNDGIDVDSHSMANTFTQNTALRDGNLDLQDASAGAGTDGTANTWRNNTAQTGRPFGLGWYFLK